MDRFQIAYGDQAMYYAGQELGIELYTPTFEQQSALKQFYEGQDSRLFEAALHSFKVHNEQSQWRRQWHWHQGHWQWQWQWYQEAKPAATAAPKATTLDKLLIKEETPAGAPGARVLAGAGEPGKIPRHFWERPKEELKQNEQPRKE